MSDAGEQPSGGREARYRVPIELGKVREIARAMKSHDPAYLDGDSPLAPAPFFYGAAYLWGHTWEQPGDSPLAEVEFDPDRVLHAEEEVTYEGPPPRAGTVLEASLRLDSTYEKTNRRGQTLRFAVAVTEFRDDRGALVATSRNTIVELPREEPA